MKMATVITDQTEPNELDEVIEDLIDELEDSGMSEDAAYAALIGFLTNIPISEIITAYQIRQTEGNSDHA